MFGIMKYIAEAIVEAQVKEAKLRKDMQDQIECLRGKVQSLNMRNDNQAALIGKLRVQLDDAVMRIPVNTQFGYNVPTCCDKLAYAMRCPSCLMAELGRIGLSLSQSKKKRYIVDTSLSTQWLYVYEDKKQRGHHIARFPYGAAGYAMACQYVDFLNSLEG